MKDSYSFDIDDAGLDASYQRYRDAYIRIFDRLGFDYVIVKATSGAMGGSKSEEFLAKAAVGEDTYVRCTQCDYAANVEAVAGAPARTRRRTTTRPRPTPRRRPTPRPSTRWSTTSTRSTPATTGPGPPATRSRTCSSCSSTPTARASRSRSACPATARSTRSGSRVSSSRSRSSRWTRPRCAKHPALVKGYIGPGVLGEKNASGIRYLVDPRVVEGTRWVTGADVAGQPRARPGRRAATSRPTARSRPPTSATATPARTATSGTPRVRARHRDGPHLPARPQVRRRARASRCSTRTASWSRSPWAPTASVPRGPSPRSPRAPSTSSGCAWPRNVAPADVHLVATGKDEAIFAAADRIAIELAAARRRRCSTTTGPRSARA